MQDMIFWSQFRKVITKPLSPDLVAACTIFECLEARKALRILRLKIKEETTLTRGFEWPSIKAILKLSFA
jgi:hypothetical protein